MSESVGFIGLGIMGSGMVHNLLASGVELTLWNRTASKIDAFEGQGAKRAESPARLAEACSLIMLCLSDTPDVEEVLLGQEGVTEGIRDGSLVIDLSTISPQATRKIADELASKGAHLLDAPVSGGSEGARDGTLSIMVGGDGEQVERARTYLGMIGDTVTHVGGNGDGQMVKLVNQILVVGTTLAISEALVFAAAGGLDLQRTIQAVEGGAAGSWMLSNRAPQMIQRDWRPGFTIDLQQKDIRLALEEGSRLRVPTLATAMVDSFYRVLQREGLGDEGNQALVKAIERLAGVEARAR